MLCWGNERDDDDGWMDDGDGGSGSGTNPCALVTLQGW